MIPHLNLRQELFLKLIEIVHNSINGLIHMNLKFRNCLLTVFQLI